MFGSNNAQANNDDPAMLDSVKQLAADPAPASVVQTTTAPAAQPVATPVAQSAPAPSAQPAPGFTSTPTPAPAAQPSTPVQPDPAPAAISVASGPANPSVSSDPVAATPSTPAPKTPTESTPAASVDHQQLAGMKQHALDHLEPLVGHLDQSAEEEFKTTMMMIQSNDNHTLLEKALDAAKRIADDKARAEALLDIINEINYFASQSTSAN